MNTWSGQLKVDPIPALLATTDTALTYTARRDLCSEPVGSIQMLWELPEAQKILKKQLPDGSWPSGSPNQARSPATNYQLFETFKQLQRLVDVYGFDNRHPAIRRAAEYVFSCQTDEGDIRGILGNQYAPYYTAMLMALLIEAGYAEDARIQKGFYWLLSVRQADGGWVIGSPGMMGKYTPAEVRRLVTQPVETLRDFDRSQPFGHSGTGMVLRAFALHPVQRETPAAQAAARLLKSHFFKKDNHSSYQSPENWVRFKYPFWWTDLVSALDSLSLIGIPREDPDVARALSWLVEHQQESGLWKVSYSSIHKASENSRSRQASLWVSLAICRIFKRYGG